MEIELHQATVADEAFLRALFEVIHAPELLPAALPAAMAAQLSDMQHRGQTMSYKAQFPAGERYIVAADDERIGRLFLNELGHELRLVDIAITPAWQGRGVGTKLLKDLQDRARQKRLPLRLSVRPASSAARFYAGLGFIEVSGTATHWEMEWQAGGEAESLNESASLAEGVKVIDAREARLGASSEAFRSLEGRELRARLATEDEVTLRIGKVQMLPVRQAGMVANDSFTVLFSGSADNVLAQATYTLRYGDGERKSELEVFLSPLGMRGEAMEYEAVFNRIVPETR